MALGKEFRFVKPKEGLLVRFPRSYTALPESGGVVPWVGPDGRYWRRRLMYGDVEIATQPKEEKIPKPNYKKLNGDKEEVKNGNII